MHGKICSFVNIMYIQNSNASLQCHNLVDMIYMLNYSQNFHHKFLYKVWWIELKTWKTITFHHYGSFLGNKLARSGLMWHQIKSFPRTAQQVGYSDVNVSDYYLKSLGHYSLNGKMSCCQTSWSLKAARLNAMMIALLEFDRHLNSSAAEMHWNSELLEMFKPESGGFEPSWDLAVRRLTA